MFKKWFPLCIFFLGLGVSFTCVAQDADDDKFPYFRLDPGLRVWGAETDAELGFRFLENLDTVLWARVSSAYKNKFFFRLGDGSLLDGEAVQADRVSEAGFAAVNSKFGIGVLQSLLPQRPGERWKLGLMLSYLTYWDYLLPDQSPDLLLRNSGDPFGSGGINTYFLLDLVYKADKSDPVTKVKEGLWADAGAEFSPPGFSSSPDLSWLRLHSTVKGFLPVQTSTRKEKGEDWNLFSSYLAAELVFDQLVDLSQNGAYLPYTLSQTIGGRYPREGLGGIVRGFTDGYLDGVGKVAANFEYRMLLPALLDRNIVPGLLVYTDFGAYWNPPRMDPSKPLNSGVVASAGIGLFLNFLDLGYGALYTNFLLLGKNYDGRQWIPISIDFGLQF